MQATVLDTLTGERKTVDGPRSWEWAENGWSCDCNRNYFGVETGKPEGICEGGKRFLVVDAVMNSADDYDYSLNALNDSYPPELVAKFVMNGNAPILRTVLGNDGVNIFA